MSDKFKELFEEARNSGVDSDWVDKFESTFNASGLRKDNQTIKEENKLLRDTTTKLRNGLLKDRFEKIGITISPSILQIPDDLDPSDVDTVQTWAETMGLIAKTETTTPDERATHDRIAAASNDGTNTLTTPDDIDPSKMSEEEFYKQARALEAQRK